MKFTYEIFPQKRLILQRYAGDFSLGELRAATERLWADPRYDRAYDGIADLSAAGTTPIEDLRGLIQFLSGNRSLSTGRWAVVVSAPYATACALLYKKAMSHRHPFEVFSTWDGACQFLGADLEPSALP